MQIEPTEVIWLDERPAVSLSELVRCSGLSEAELRELVAYGALAPTNPLEVEWSFSGDIVLTVQAAGRLRADLELEPQALALALTLIGRIRDLEAQLGELRAQLPQRQP